MSTCVQGPCKSYGGSCKTLKLCFHHATRTHQHKLCYCQLSASMPSEKLAFSCGKCAIFFGTQCRIVLPIFMEEIRTTGLPLPREGVLEKFQDRRLCFSLSKTSHGFQISSLFPELGCCCRDLIISGKRLSQLTVWDEMTLSFEANCESL